MSQLIYWDCCDPAEVNQVPDIPHCSAPVWIWPKSLFISTSSSSTQNTAWSESTSLNSVSSSFPEKRREDSPHLSHFRLALPSLLFPSPENGLIGFLWQKGKIRVHTYTHFSGTAALLFPQRGGRACQQNDKKHAVNTDDV